MRNPWRLKIAVGKFDQCLRCGLVFETKDDLAALGIIKRGEEFFRGSNDTGGRRAGRRVRLGKAVQPSAE
jgi:predicted  nucleic acid-binding Zn-ribbon protein